MNEMTIETMDIIDGVRAMRKLQKESASKFGDKDKYGYEFEYSDSFGTDTLKFQETAMMLEVEANETFRIMREINRHSPLYFRMCAQLEKLISQLGSVCITKAVKEQQEGDTFKLLERMTIPRLREMTAFNFRKCYQSFMESQATLMYNANALDFSIRWSALDKRLLATEEKIEKIKAGKLKIEISTPQEKLAEQLKDQDETAVDMSAAGKPVAESAPDPVKKPETPAAFVSKGRAISVDKSSFGITTQTGAHGGLEPCVAQLGEAPALNPIERSSYYTEQVASVSSCASPVSKKDHADLNEDQSAAEAVAAVGNAQPEQESDELNQLPAAVKTEENKASAEFSAVEDIHSEAENDDFSVEDPDEVPDVESAEGDEYETDAEEDLPFVSEELVRRMSAFVNSQEFLRLQIPEYEYALPP